MRRSRYQLSVRMKYQAGRAAPRSLSRDSKPRRCRMFPTTQNPVSATAIENAPVAITPSANSGCANLASAVNASNTTPAISHTVRSMYHSLVGTTYIPRRSAMPVLLCSLDGVAALAVLLDGEPVAGLVRVGMAAEAAVRRRVAHLIRVSPPADFHLREDVAPVDRPCDGDRPPQHRLLEVARQVRLQRVANRLIDLLIGGVVAGVIGTQRPHRLAANERNLAVDQRGANRLVHGPLRRRAEGVRRAVVTVGALHPPQRPAGDGVGGDPLGEILAHRAISGGALHVNDLLVLFVFGEILDHVRAIHVPMNPAAAAGARYRPADMQP